jgi:SAM-dependent methyltransferase
MLSAVKRDSPSEAGFNRALVEYLCCPACGGDLWTQRSETGAAEEALRCACGRSYEIRQGVPVLLAEVSAAERFTAKNFGEQWDYFHRLGGLGALFEEGEFADYFHPISISELAGKVMLEGGCGYGRNVLQCQRAGAKLAIGFDVSPAAFIAKQRGADVVIGDILNPPFKASAFDVVFTFGVLQHVSRPFEGLKQLHARLRPGGLFCHSVYSYENNRLLAEALTPLRQRLFRRLPLPLRKGVAYTLGVISSPVAAALYAPLYYFRPVRGWASRNVFYFDFVMLCFRRGFRGWVAQIFDQINAPLAEYFRRSDVEHWMAELQLTDRYTFFRNQNTWSFGGRKTRNGA